MSELKGWKEIYKKVYNFYMKRKWQDIVMMLACLGFSYSLIPQIIYNIKYNSVGLSWQTIIITCFGMICMSICFYSLKLFYTAAMNTLSSICWIIILSQKIFI